MGWFETAGKNISTAWSGFSAADTAGSAYNSVSNAASAVSTWVTDTALPAAADWGEATAKFTIGAGSNIRVPYLGVPITPFAMAHDISNAIAPDSAMAKWMREGKEDASNYGSFVAENPGRAGALVAQGLANSVTSIGAIAVDLGRSVVWDYTVKQAPNLLIAAVNLGHSEDDKIPYFEAGEFLRASKWAEENSKIANWQFLDMSEEARKVWEEPQEYNKDGKLNPNYRYEKGTLYGSQALFDVVTIVPAAVLTGGAAGAAYAGAKGTAYTARTIGTFSHLRNVQVVEDALKITSKVENAAKNLQEAAIKVNELKTAGASAQKIAKAEAKAEKAADKLATVERTTAKDLDEAIAKVEKRGTTTQEAVQKEARDLEKAQKKLDDAQAAGKSGKTIDRLREKVDIAEQAVLTKAEKAAKVGAEQSASLGKIDFSSMSTTRNVLETTLDYGRVGNRITNPLYDGKIGTAINGAATVGAFAAYVSAKDANDKEKNAMAAASAQALLPDDGGNSLAGLSERIRARKAALAAQNSQPAVAQEPSAHRPDNQATSVTGTAATAPLTIQFTKIGDVPNAIGVKGIPDSQTAAQQPLIVQFKSVSEMPDAGAKGGYVDIFKNSAEKQITVTFSGLPQRDDNTTLPAALLQQPPSSSAQYKAAI